VLFRSGGEPSDTGGGVIFLTPPPYLCIINFYFVSS
jgi:hypothetical protein